MKRTLARILTVCVALTTAGVISVAPAPPAAAAACAFAGHVYAQGGNFKFETDPLDGPFHQLFARGTVGFVRLGANGIHSGTRPTWSVFSGNSGQFIGTLDGSTANSGCVSNEKVFSFFGSRGDFYLVKANYFTGNTLRSINQQTTSSSPSSSARPDRVRTCRRAEASSVGRQEW